MRSQKSVKSADGLSSCILPTRREFVAKSAILTATLVGGGAVLPGEVLGSESEPPRNRGRIFKSVKWGMIGSGSTVLEKFQICRDLGFDGMELAAPSLHDAEEVTKASLATGMPVHGTVGQKHWSVRLSSPDATIREQAVADLRIGLEDTAAYGGDSILLVPGLVGGEDEDHEAVWERSIAGIRQVLPVSSKLGVRILIENVWNGFCETPEQLRDYIDEIGSPWVGVYFDIGNVRKFGPSEDWIRALSSRIVKLDVKDWGESNGFCKIGDGDVDWDAVQQALNEIGFTGWCTAEVAGGDRKRLAEIASRMDEFLAL